MINEFPQDYINRMKKQMGEEYDSFIKSYELPYVKSLRVNLLKISPKDCVSLLGKKQVSDCDLNKFGVPWESAGVYYCEEDEEKACGLATDSLLVNSPGKSPLHEAGAYYIQEASAMLPVTMLDLDHDGLTVLDLCAAPGGKSTQIAAYLKGRGLLVSNEIVSSRALILSENIERMGVRNALVVSEDPNKLSDRFAGFFDRILVDAPCSGEGMFRKHPEAMEEWSLDNVDMCAARQDMILDCAANMLAFGGKIVYSTCTFSMEEDEGSCERFLKRHPEFEICDAPTRLFPHKERGEGHFAVSFVRTGQTGNCEDTSFAAQNELSGKDCSMSARKSEKRKSAANQGKMIFSKEEKQALSTFVGETFCSESNISIIINECLNVGKSYALSNLSGQKLVRFGDCIYLAPVSVPDTNGLKVMRIGLKLGEFKKNRFEPDHAFCMATAPADVKNYCDYDYKSAEIAGFLNGMTLTVNESDDGLQVFSDKKGWCLVCVNGVSLGWGKIAGNIIKNHYPKGLRIQK